MTGHPAGVHPHVCWAGWLEHVRKLESLRFRHACAWQGAVPQVLNELAFHTAALQNSPYMPGCLNFCCRFAVAAMLLQVLAGQPQDQAGLATRAVWTHGRC